jgi:hypothetical protein
MLKKFSLILSSDWFKTKPADIQQCIFQAAVANDDASVMKAFTKCRINNDHENCYMKIDEIRRCLE